LSNIHVQHSTHPTRLPAHSRHKQALKSIIVKTPTINILLDIRNSNYEDWSLDENDNG
jgi:hypothetical protein